jgi:septal ring factor EnvC (AmiA/AmiB activator)
MLILIDRKADFLKKGSFWGMQASYEIHTFEDLLNVLKAEPMWLEELRKLILTSDLLKLPERFEEFVQKDFKELNDRVDRMEQEMIGLKDEVKELKDRVEKIDERLTKVESDVEVFKEDVRTLKNDVAELKGSDFERKVRENAPAYLGKLIRKCKVLDKAIIADQLDEALDAGRITEEEREEALSVDLVAEGYLRVEPQKKVLVVAEVSVKADKVDVERAHKRSKLVEKAFGSPTIPAVIGKKYTAGAKNKAKELQIYLV